MLVVGTGDGVYRVTGLADSVDADVRNSAHGRSDSNVRKVLDVPRAECVRRFDAVDGLFAATKAGLYHSPDGTEWTDLRVPEEAVYAVAPGGERIYAGTRPARVYAAPLPDGGLSEPTALEWRELSGFRDLPSREEWGVPRHDNVAQVRGIRVHPDSPNRIVVGVEPGGVHVSEDAGATWEERKRGVHDDVHGLHGADDGTSVAATGVGLYRTEDAGRSWTRLDEGVEQRYFRAAHRHEGVLYASAACLPPNEWERPDADPALFEWRNGNAPERIESPRPDGVVVGWTAADGDLFGLTHRGTLLEKSGGEWRAVGEIPGPDTLYGRFGSLAWRDR